MKDFAKLTLLEGPISGAEFDLTLPSNTLGREAPANILVPAKGVSRLHAKITLLDGKYILEDLNSTNGTYVNSERITAPTPLTSGDSIGLGQSVVLYFQTGISAAPSAAVPVQAADSPAKALATVLGDVAPPEDAPPPQLTVSVAGSPLQIFSLTQEQYTLGRLPENDIVLNSPIVSRHHATLQRASDGGYQLIVAENVSNPVHLAGKPVTGTVRLAHNAKLRIGGADPGTQVTMAYHAPAEAAKQVTIEFDEKDTVQIGRDAGNDVVLNVPQVSRYHAQIERVGKRFRVRDLRSANGTFVNEQPIEGDVWLQPGDTIRIGMHRFEVGEDSLAQFDETGGLRVEAIGLNKWVRKDLNILKDISVVFQPREFIVVVGQSGGGKSTLVDSIAGYRPATHGRVLVNGVDAYKNFDAIRNNIGFVPQKDIIHTELTPYQALDYAAQLRMPADTSKAERHQRIMETLEDLDIAHRKDTQISGLSGGQLKRVSIGVELLTKPGLFFLDEPTSGLDPGTETALMQLMRRLADAGRTIVLITHATKNVMLADKVIFLARGGYLVWFGAPNEALAYFDEFRSERDRRARAIEFDEIYAILDDSSKGKPEKWAERFKQTEAYQKYIVSELAGKQPATVPAPARGAPPQPAAKPARKVSALRQFFILSSRNLKILTRDRFSLFLMLAAAPLVGLLDILLANLMGRAPFAFDGGDVNAVIITLFLMTIYGVMVGGIAQMREIVKEGDVYKRERLVNLKIFPYILSKVWVAGLLALYQALWYIGIHYFAFDMPGGATEFVLMYISMVLGTMAGMMLGLFASALAPTANAAPLIVILLMLPQIVLGGALVPVPSFVSAPTATRWAFQGFMAIGGAGSDVAADVCWLLPKETRDLMTLEQKNAECNCMGLNIIDQNSCNFPGMGNFYNEAVFAEPPAEPIPLGDPPPEPIIPPPPPEPDDPTNQVAVAEYLAALQAWQVSAEAVRGEFEAALKDYQARADIYAAEFAAYQETLIQQQIIIEGAVRPAEGALGVVNEKYGWTFVDKNNSEAYWGTLINTWAAQMIIMSVLFIGILILQKRKDS